MVKCGVEDTPVKVIHPGNCPPRWVRVRLFSRPILSTGDTMNLVAGLNETGQHPF